MAHNIKLSIASNLFISNREANILRLAAHSWLLWNSITTLNTRYLGEQRDPNRKPIFHRVSFLLNILIGLGSGYCAASAAWRLTS